MESIKITRTEKRKLFKTAWALMDRFDSFGKALSHAWKILKLRLKMKIGNVRFSFTKVDGSIRDAVGTLNIDYDFKGGSIEQFKTMPYYDCEANGWRSFKLENLI